MWGVIQANARVVVRAVQKGDTKKESDDPNKRRRGRVGIRECFFDEDEAAELG
jgi:hypothetical protein